MDPADIILDDNFLPNVVLDIEYAIRKEIRLEKMAKTHQTLLKDPINNMFISYNHAEAANGGLPQNGMYDSMQKLPPAPPTPPIEEANTLPLHSGTSLRK